MKVEIRLSFLLFLFGCTAILWWNVAQEVGVFGMLTKMVS